MRVLVTGGCGYVGSLLVPRLLTKGYYVRVYDIQWFGDGFLPKDNGHCEVIKGDIRDIRKFGEACLGIDSIIHLACVSNDNSCQLDEALSTTINLDAFEPLVVAAKQAGVRRFIYCSSSSVYGSSDAPDVTEEHPLIPLTLYNKYKGMCEPLLLKHLNDDFTGVILRPATVCGYAPRMRFDLTANILTRDAVMKKKITVFGGEQKRPNLDIRDMCRAYEELLVAPKEKIQGQRFNFGSENLTLNEIAKRVKTIVEDEGLGPVEIVTEKRQDNRSYHINSEKIKRVLGLEPKYKMEDAVRDLVIRMKDGYFRDALTNPVYTNVAQLCGFGLGKTGTG